MIDDNNTKEQSPSGRTGCLEVLGYAALVVIIIMLLGTWWVKYNIYASEFSPTTLNQKEQKALDSKIARLEESPNSISHNELMAIKDRCTEIEDAINEIKED